MDITTHVTVLRMHSEYLSQLITELNTAVALLDQPLDEQEKKTATKTKELIERIAKVEGQLLTDTEILCQRVTLFLQAYAEHAHASLDAEEME